MKEKIMQLDKIRSFVSEEFQRRAFIVQQRVQLLSNQSQKPLADDDIEAIKRDVFSEKPKNKL